MKRAWEDSSLLHIQTVTVCYVFNVKSAGGRGWLKCCGLSDVMSKQQYTLQLWPLQEVSLFLRIQLFCTQHHGKSIEVMADRCFKGRRKGWKQFYTYTKDLMLLQVLLWWWVCCWLALKLKNSKENIKEEDWMKGRLQCAFTRLLPDFLGQDNLPIFAAKHVLYDLLAYLVWSPSVFHICGIPVLVKAQIQKHFMITFVLILR